MIGTAASSRKRILIYNPISGYGHFDSWTGLFAKIIADCGFDVAVLTPDPTIFDHDFFGSHRSKIKILQWAESPARPIAYQISRRIRRQWTAVLGDDPVLMAVRVNDSIKKSGFSPDLIFNMYLDTYGDDHYQWRQFSKYCHLPLAGIRVTPIPGGEEGLCQLEQFLGIFFLDEKFLTLYSSLFPRLVIKCLPDITRSDVTSESPVVEAVLRRAQGRHIVFMGGAIGRQKNLTMWCKLIEKADPQQWFFVQVGEWIPHLLDPQDNASLRLLQESNRENLFLHNQYLKDEGEMNALIQHSDIVFAVYKNFPHSSNMPAKAALFSKPILVSDRYLMGERIRTYGIGLAVDETDVDAMLEGLEALIKNPPVEEKFSTFRQEIGEDHVRTVVEDFLKRSLTSGAADSGGVFK